MEGSTEPTAGTSRRAQHFRSALNLVHKKAATAWTLDEFLDCVGSWGEQNHEMAAAMRVQLGQYLQEADQEKAADILERYNAYEGIDGLAEAIAEAKMNAIPKPATTKSRRSSSHKGKGRDGDEDAVQAKRKDAWREDLDPETRVRAVTVPLLEAEKLRLEKDLAEVEKLAWDAVKRFREHRDKAIEAKVQTSRILDRVDHARKAYESLNDEEISEWTMSQLTGGNRE